MNLRAVSADHVPVERIAWLVPGRIPAIGVTLLVGDPGIGKSLLTVDLAARASRGELDAARPFALMVTAEDALGAVVVPRLQAAGAVLSGVAFLEPGDEWAPPMVLPDDAHALEHKVEFFAPCLIVIDPLSAFLSVRINSWQDQAVRHALRPLHMIVERHHCAVLVVAHLNKAIGADPLYRTGGSVGIPAAARSALLLGRDPDDPDGERGQRRVLAQFKSNYGELAPSVAYEIESTVIEDAEIRTPRLHEIGESAHVARALLEQPQGDQRSQRAQAIEFLETELAGGPRPARELKAAASEAMIAPRTLDRAKTELGVESRKEGLRGGWTWVLPEGRHPHLDHVASFDDQTGNELPKGAIEAQERHPSRMASSAELDGHLPLATPRESVEHAEDHLEHLLARSALEEIDHDESLPSDLEVLDYTAETEDEVNRLLAVCDEAELGEVLSIPFRSRREAGEKAERYGARALVDGNPHGPGWVVREARRPSLASADGTRKTSEVPGER